MKVDDYQKTNHILESQCVFWMPTVPHEIIDQNLE